MNYLANKPFSFLVDSYEEWTGGRCISKGPLNARIHVSIIGEEYIINMDGVDSLIINNKGSFGLLKDGDAGDLGDRLQYVNPNLSFNNYDTLEPIVCHLFYLGRKINYIRFAMTNPDRIIEFYGKTESFDGTYCPIVTPGKKIPSLKSSIIDDIIEQYSKLLKDNTINIAIIDHQISTIAFCLRRYLNYLTMTEDPEHLLMNQLFKDTTSIISQFYPIFGNEALDDAREWFHTIISDYHKAEIFVQLFYEALDIGKPIDSPAFLQAFNLH